MLVFLIGMLIPTILVGTLGLFLADDVIERFRNVIQEGETEVLPSILVQNLIDEAIIPPNEYLALGDSKEVARFHYISARVDVGFERLAQTAFDIPEEHSQLQEAMGYWIVTRHVATLLLDIPNPVKDAEAARLMALMDYLAIRASKKLREMFFVAQEERQIELARADRANQQRTTAVLLIILANGFVAQTRK
jgi:hypothetical protein